MAKPRRKFEDLVQRVGPLPVTGLASAESPPGNTRGKVFTVSRAEARELTRRAEEVVKEMLADMEIELRRMVSEYDGKAARSRELLEALVIAEEEGVPASFCAEIRHELAARFRKLRAA